MMRQEGRWADRGEQDRNTVAITIMMMKATTKIKTLVMIMMIIIRNIFYDKKY